MHVELLLLAREFGGTAQTIANSVGQAAIDRGKPLPGKDGLTTLEREALLRFRRENRQLQIEREMLSKATAWFAGTGDKAFAVFELMSASHVRLPVQSMCPVLDVSASRCYAWQGRAPSKRATQEAVLTDRIRLLQATSEENYGSPNIDADRRDEGTRVGRKRGTADEGGGVRGVSCRRNFAWERSATLRQRHAQSVFASLERELIDRRSFKTNPEARVALFTPGSRPGTTRAGSTLRTAVSRPSTSKACRPTSNTEHRASSRCFRARHKA